MKFRKKIRVKCKEEHSICEVHNGKLKEIAVVDEGEEYVAVLNEETEEYFARDLEGREFMVGEIRFDKDLKMDKLVLSEEFELVEEMNELEKYIKENSKDELIVGETTLGKFYIRPRKWTGIWKDSKLIGGNCLAYFETREEAEKELIRLGYESNI